MTLPTSGPISIGMVAAELGIGLPLSLGDPRVRALAGVPSGPISLSQLRGKSAYTPMTVNSTDGYAGVYDTSFSGGTAACSPSASVTGGTGGYTYAWSFTSNPNSCTLSSPNSSSCGVSRTFTKNANGSASATLQCVVTDNTAHVVTKADIYATMEWSNGA